MPLYIYMYMCMYICICCMPVYMLYICMPSRGGEGDETCIVLLGSSVEWGMNSFFYLPNLPLLWREISACGTCLLHLYAIFMPCMCYACIYSVLACVLCLPSVYVGEKTMKNIL